VLLFEKVKLCPDGQDTDYKSAPARAIGTQPENPTVSYCQTLTTSLNQRLISNFKYRLLQKNKNLKLKNGKY
jgi:hypothetical protein